VSATSGHPLLRSRIADHLTKLVEDHGARALGRSLGIAGTTVTRWEGDPYAFGFHAVDLAISDDQLWELISAYRNGEMPVVGEAVRVQSDLFAVLTSCTELMHEVAADLKDGRITPPEAKRLLKLLRRVVVLITERVIPDLEALHG
jgi:hypothetical protein